MQYTEVYEENYSREQMNKKRRSNRRQLIIITLSDLIHDTRDQPGWLFAGYGPQILFIIEAKLHIFMK